MPGGRKLWMDDVVDPLAQLLSRRLWDMLLMAWQMRIASVLSGSTAGSLLTSF